MISPIPAEWPDYWTPVRMNRSVPKVAPDIQTAFRDVWIQTKNLNTQCEDHRASS
jgi:hypothetical protein